VRLALDTNAYVALHAGSAPGLVDAVRTATQLALPIVVLGELRFGFLNGTRASENEAALERFLALPRVDVLLIDDATTNHFGEIATVLRRAGTPIQQNDVWIAALCKQHGYVLATGDRGLAGVLGLRILDVAPAG
jgi:predicted nucleic acid-binding protein